MSPQTGTARETGPQRRAATGILRSLIFAVVLLLASVGLARAQEAARLVVSDTLWEIRLAAGESYIGRVVAVSGDSITLQTSTGTRIQFTRSQAVRVRLARGAIRQGAFWPEDPNRTRLFFSPTGRSLARGDGYFGVYELFIPFVAYGITDNLLIAGGSPFYLALANDFTPPVYIGPKLKVLDFPKFEGSLGALAVIVPDDEEVYSLGIFYGVGTYGTPDNAVTGGLGWGYIEDEIASQPVVMLGGETRLGRNVKLMTENLFVPGADDAGLLYSVGIRFFSGRLSADAALAGFTDEGGDGCTLCIPVVNFVYNFGGGQ